MLSSEDKSFVLSLTGALKIRHISEIQGLWSGYGTIVRVMFDDADPVVVKKIRWPESRSHPRGWATDISHQRKVRSYDVEVNFYQQLSHYCDEKCRVADLLGVQKSDEQILLVLEDLNHSGFGKRVDSISRDQLRQCISWLAHFHARFLQAPTNGLWPKGTYWHLDTRPDELAALGDARLKRAAPVLDRALWENVPLTLVHGDAKVANFCFSEGGSSVAAVDFQYLGGGCGMKDLAYFVGSCLDERECEALEGWVLDTYFHGFHCAVNTENLPIHSKTPLQLDAIETSWRKLYPIAWADFHRFLLGWSPGHKKIHRYSEKMCERAYQLLASYS